VGADEAHPADSDGRVLKQRLRRVGPVDDDDQRLEKNRNVLFHVAAQLHRYLAGGPRGVVADGDVVGVEVLSEDGHELGDARVNVGEAGLGEVAEESEGALANLRHRILDALSML